MNAVDANLVMKVWPCCESGTAYVANQLAFFNLL